MTKQLPDISPSADERIASDETFMRLALEQANLAAKAGEVPIGAVVVCEGEVVARAHNMRESATDPAGHAEVLAIRQAAKVLETWRLSSCTIYVTLEPCIMCAGLLHQARIGRCVFGAFDEKAGALASLYSVGSDERLNHQYKVDAGVLQDECAEVLQDFFQKRRNKEQ